LGIESRPLGVSLSGLMAEAVRLPVPALLFVLGQFHLFACHPRNLPVVMDAKNYSTFSPYGQVTAICDAARGAIFEKKAKIFAPNP